EVRLAEPVERAIEPRRRKWLQSGKRDAVDVEPRRQRGRCFRSGDNDSDRVRTLASHEFFASGERTGEDCCCCVCWLGAVVSQRGHDASRAAQRAVDASNGAKTRRWGSRALAANDGDSHWASRERPRLASGL